MITPLRRIEPFALLAVIVLCHAIFQFYLRSQMAEFSILSADNIHRTLLALEWRRHPAFFIDDSSWLPLFFWVYGAFLAVYPDPVWAPRVLTIVISSLWLIPFFGICRRLGPGGPWGALFVTCVAAFMPPLLIIGLGPHADPLFILILLSAAYAWLRSEQGKNQGWHWVSIAAMAAATLTRFEAWIFTLVWLASNYRLPRWRFRCLALLAPPVLGVHQLLEYGRLEFLHSLTGQRLFSTSSLRVDWGDALSVWGDVFLRGWLLAFLFLAMFFLDTKRKAVRDFLVFAWIPLLIMTVMGVFGGYPLPGEHLLVFLVLGLAPLAPMFERAMLVWPQPLKIIFILATLLGSSLGIRVLMPPIMAHAVETRGRAERAADVIHSKIRHWLAEEDRILLELPLRGTTHVDAADGHADPRMYQLAAIPNEVLFDRGLVYTHTPSTQKFVLADDAGPSVLDLTSEELRGYLKEESVRLIMAQAARKESLAKIGWVQAGRLGGHWLYARMKDPLAARLRPLLQAHSESGQDAL